MLKKRLKGKKLIINEYMGYIAKYIIPLLLQLVYLYLRFLMMQLSHFVSKSVQKFIYM